MVKVNVKGMTIEGTPEEVREMMALLDLSAGDATSQAVPRSAASADGTEYISYDTARTALTRRPLHPIQKRLFKLIYDGHPRYVSGYQLQGQLEYTRPQFSGLMGALGRRFAYTQGYIPGQLIFCQQWNENDLCYYYKLPDALKQALEDLGLVGGRGAASGK